MSQELTCFCSCHCKIAIFFSGRNFSAVLKVRSANSCAMSAQRGFSYVIKKKVGEMFHNNFGLTKKRLLYTYDMFTQCLSKGHVSKRRIRYGLFR